VKIEIVGKKLILVGKKIKIVENKILLLSTLFFEYFSGFYFMESESRKYFPGFQITGYFFEVKVQSTLSSMGPVQTEVGVESILANLKVLNGREVKVEVLFLLIFQSILQSESIKVNT